MVEDDWDEILDEEDLVDEVEGVESEEVEAPLEGVEDLVDEDEIDLPRRKLSKRDKLPKYEEARVGYSAQDIVVSVGDYIEIDFDDGPSERVLRGKIVEMYSDRAVPDVDEIVSGTPQDPALKVEIYTKIGDEWMSTGKFVGMKMSQLQRSGELR